MESQIQQFNVLLPLNGNALFYMKLSRLDLFLPCSIDLSLGFHTTVTLPWSRNIYNTFHVFLGHSPLPLNSVAT